MRTRIHAVAGTAAFLLVAAFLTASVVVEIFGGPAAVAAVKTVIVYAVAVLVPCLIVATGSGRSLAAGHDTPLLRRKRRRAAVIGTTGVLVLVPCAFVLRHLAATGDLSATFAAVQAVELVAGAVNLTLLGRNARDGRHLAAARRARRPATVRPATDGATGEPPGPIPARDTESPARG